MPIAELSANTIDIVSGDIFHVIEEWRIVDRLVSATSDFNKDSRLPVGTYAADAPPVANAGGLWFGFLDSGQAFATVTFDATASFVVDPDSSTFTVLWDVGDGTITVGTSTSTTITVRFPAGFRHVALTVTDSGNSKSTVRYVPVRVYDPAGSLPLRVTSLSLNSATKDGWSGEIEIARESAPTLTNLPDGSLIVLFEQAYYGTTQASYRSAVANRSHILASLFLESETIDFQPGSGAVTFRAEGPLAVLKRTPALPQLMIGGSTADWQHVKGLTVNRALWYLAYWHATVMDYFDFIWVTSGTDLHYDRIAVENIDSIAGQLADVSTSICADPTCDALGRILVIRDPRYLSASDRSALITTWNFTTADIVDGSMDRIHHGSVKHVRGEGITSGNVAVFSNAGNAPSPIGVGSETLSRQIIVNQAQLNVRTGKHFALINGLYNGRFVPQGVRLTVPDGYAIFDPAYREFITLTLASSTNDRAVSFDTSTKWVVDAISISYDGDTGGRDVEVTVSHETDGADGVTYVPPADTTGDVNTPADDYPIVPYVPPGGDLPSVQLYQGTQRIAAICSNGLALTTVFGSAALTTWAYATWASLSVSGTVLQWVPDGFVPGSGLLVTSTKAYYGALATGVFTQVFSFGTSSIWRGADASFAEPGVFSIASQYATGVKTLTTRDYFASFVSLGEVTVTSFHNTGTPFFHPPIYVSSKSPGRMIVPAMTSNSTTPPSHAYVSPDYGATWNSLSTPTISALNALIGELHFPYNNNPTDSLAVYIGDDDMAGHTALWRASGATVTDITPSTGGNDYAPELPRGGIVTSAMNRNRAFTVGGTQPGLTNYAVFRSDNLWGAAAWIVIDPPGSVYRRVFIAGDNEDVVYLVGELGSIALSTDAGTAIIDQSGNLPSFTPGDVLAIAGY